MIIITGIFVELLHISLLSSGMIIIVLAVHKIFGKRLSGKMSYLMWALVLLRLVFPISIHSPLSLENTLPAPFEVFYEKDNPIETHMIDNDILTYGSLNKEIYDYPTSRDKWMTMITFIWLFGIFAVMFFPIISYVTLKKALGDDEEANGKQLSVIGCEARRLSNTYKIAIKYSYYLDAPALIGVFNPMILLPYSMKEADDETLLHVLLHEMIHYKRQHLLLQWGFWLIKALHWFNPLVWLAHEWMKLDGEFACDEEVIQLLGKEKKIAYGKVLIHLADASDKSPYGINAAGLINRDSELKKRILRIGYTKPSSKVLSVLTIIIMVIMLPLFFTIQAKETSYVKDFFTSLEVDFEPKVKEEITLDFLGYTFDSKSGDMSVIMHYELTEEFMDNVPKVLEMAMNFEIRFSKSYDSLVRNKGYSGYGEITAYENPQSEPGIMEGILKSGDVEVTFNLPDYEKERFGNPTLYFNGCDLLVINEKELNISAEDVGKVYDIDGFLSISVLSLDLSKALSASIIFKASNPLNKEIEFNEELILFDSEGSLIPTSGTSGGFGENTFEFNIKASDSSQLIDSIGLNISSYRLKIGDGYYSYNRDTLNNTNWPFVIDESEEK